MSPVPPAAPENPGASSPPEAPRGSATAREKAPGPTRQAEGAAAAAPGVVDAAAESAGRAELAANGAAAPADAEKEGGASLSSSSEEEEEEEEEEGEEPRAWKLPSKTSLEERQQAGAGRRARKPPSWLAQACVTCVAPGLRTISAPLLRAPLSARASPPRLCDCGPSLPLGAKRMPRPNNI